MKLQRGSRVLIIGGAGYIGSALLPKLLERGYLVRVVDLLLFGTEPITDVINHPSLEIVQADFRERESLAKAMKGVGAVVHLGAIVGDPACAVDEYLTVDVNMIATAQIAEAAREAGVSRFVFASTCSVYGASDDVLDEQSALNPVSLYAHSKIAAEKRLLRMADDSFAPVILRFSTIYGLSGRIRFDLVVNLLAAKAASEGQITVFGGGQWRPFLHVDDAALAVLKALEAPLSLVRNQIFNVGSETHNYTIQQVAEIVRDHVPTAEVVTMGAGDDRRNYRVKFDKIRNALGFVPQWTLEQGVRQIVDVMRTGKVRDYRDARYSNVKSLSEEGASWLRRSSNGNGSASTNGNGHASENGNGHAPVNGTGHAPVNGNGHAPVNGNRGHEPVHATNGHTEKAPALGNSAGNHTERRRSLRHQGTPLNVLLWDLRAGAEPARGWVVNRSLEGMCLTMEKPPAPGTLLAVRAANAECIMPWVHVEVRNGRPQNGQWQVGCHLLGDCVSPESQNGAQDHIAPLNCEVVKSGWTETNPDPLGRHDG